MMIPADMPQPPLIDQPIALALIGAGNRSRTVYAPLFSSLAPWVRLVAVCDPVRDHADALANRLGVPAFYSIHELVAARPMEAALVVTPIPSHHAISCYLSAHGVHNLVETSMASLLSQAREMVATAREQQVVLRIAENFFRFPFDRIAKRIDATGFLGPVKRLTSFHDHVGYHNNSRWIVFYGAHPVAVQALEHTMPVAPHYEAAHRFHDHETFRARFFHFPDDRLVTDLAGNIKGLLGRYPRPGYTEIDAARGTIVHQARGAWQGTAEVRSCSDEALRQGAVADGVFPVVDHYEDRHWLSTVVDLPIGRVEYVNPYRPTEHVPHVTASYGACLMDHVVDFAGAVRGVRDSEYTAEDALMAMAMEVGARESALRGGERVGLPLAGELIAEDQARRALHEKYGVDPLDIEGMLAISYPRP
jgi:hypothetical protein